MQCKVIQQILLLEITELSADSLFASFSLFTSDWQLLLRAIEYGEPLTEGIKDTGQKTKFLLLRLLKLRSKSCIF